MKIVKQLSPQVKFWLIVVAAFALLGVGTKVFYDTITVGTLNNVRYIDGTKFAKTAAGVNAADADCGAGSCVIVVPSAGTYSDTTIQLSKHHYLQPLTSGTFVVAGIRGPDSTTDTTADWGIECPQRAILQLAAGANTDVIADSTFLTLSGSGNTFGTFSVRIKGCQIDGNKANQSALVTSGTGTPSTVARSAGGVVTIVLTGTPSPAIAAGQTCNVKGISNDTFTFNGRYIAQAGTGSNTLVFFQNPVGHNTIGTVAATQATNTGTFSVICYSGASGIRLFGRNNKIQDVAIYNNVLDGLWTEGYTPAAFVDNTSQLDYDFVNLKVMNSGGNGWTFWGPQNSKSINFTSYQHGQWGRELLQPLFDSHAVSFLNGAGGLHIWQGGSIQQTTSQESAAAGWGILVENAAGPNLFSSDFTFCNGCIAFETRTPNQNYQGIIGGSVPNNLIGVKFNGGSGIFNVTMTGNTTWFDCTSEVGQPLIILGGTDQTGTLRGTGCWGGAETVIIGNQGSVAGDRNTLVLGPISKIISGGWTQTIPTGVNSTLAVLGLSQSFTSPQSFSQINIASLLASNTAPSIAGAGCGGSAASIATNNGTASFSINVGTTPTTACTVTLPAAANGWNCSSTDITTNSTTVFLQKQTATGTTSATITNFNDVAVASNFTANDIVQMSCFAR